MSNVPILFFFLKIPPDLLTPNTLLFFSGMIQKYDDKIQKCCFALLRGLVCFEKDERYKFEVHLVNNSDTVTDILNQVFKEALKMQAIDVEEQKSPRSPRNHSEDKRDSRPFGNDGRNNLDDEHQTNKRKDFSRLPLPSDNKQQFKSDNDKRVVPIQERTDFRKNSRPDSKSDNDDDDDDVEYSKLARERHRKESSPREEESESGASNDKEDQAAGAAKKEPTGKKDKDAAETEENKGGNLKIIME